MSGREIWPLRPPEPGAETPERGGMSQLRALEAGLTDNPGSSRPSSGRRFAMASPA
jgi:hypothetical protein